MTAQAGGRNVLLWHVHGSWTDSFVRGPHHCVLPTLAEGGPWGRGRCGRAWESATEVPLAELRDAEVDVVILQRPEEIDLVEQWLGRRPGRDIPAVYLEHNVPRSDPASARHPLADRTDIPIVHVTHFNDLMWDNGRAPTHVIQHGIVDPGEQYTGELPHGVALINEPSRRARVTGSDLLAVFADAGPVDLFGIGAADFVPASSTAHPVRGIDDLDHAALHPEMARRRVYLHTARWTSLGLSLLEAMQLGMPVVVLAATETTMAVPSEAGAVSTDVSVLVRAFRELLHEPDLAVLAGRAGRDYAVTRYGLDRFHRDWTALLAEVTR
ncbi:MULTISPECIES: glycosyltransferase [Actinoalloteichus]|uniref:Glycosyl transferase group 1 n=1 Tax=Actinoalloteichus fjordicus TaxID=1612552 RepID=A0AAC9LC06_9PSEU|nr:MULTISPECIES: glycosyltransferase [Actinoalloteichus]APU14139.1 glycosyl transferase group 1 [Actinoalloteichus fjordicus]APU20085.1 glycosyl transferase group 1 [Actinoalloteichus sp. GBA129-24]